MSFAVSLIIIFALCIIGAPIGLSATGHPIGAIASSIMIGSGIFLVVTCSIILIITKLYVKTKASEAFVRTGMGGLRVIQDGGAIVLPVIHQIVRVPLETIPIHVKRSGADAFLTADKLRSDIEAQFFIRVAPEEEAIKTAARSIGERQDVGQLVEEKLISALRSAAAKKSLEQLNSDRESFLKEVLESVKGDLDHNGFTLESVSLSKLDQTDQQFLKQDNIFDAQGMRTIAEITQKQLTERNLLVRNGEQERTSQDVETRQKVLALELTRAQAEAKQATEIAVSAAEQMKLAREKEIATQQAIEVAAVQQQQAVEVARRAQQQVIEVAERAKLQAVTQADEKLEVARRSQQEAVAKAEAQRALQEAKLAEAEAERMKSRQAIATVEVVATAEREQRKAVIAAEAEAEKGYVQAKKKADAEAYRVNVEAEAKKKSADAEAEAVQKAAAAKVAAQKLEAEGAKAVAVARAEGDRAQLVAKAEGDRAIAMVPVDVEAKRVEIEQRRINEVLKPELEARAANGEAAQNFELEKIRIEKEAEVRIETAKATVNLYNKITANVYGTPEDAAKMAAAFGSGFGFSQIAEGFLAGASAKTVATAEKSIDTVSGVVKAVAERVSGNGQTNAEK